MGVAITSFLSSTITVEREKFDKNIESSYAFGLFLNAYDSKHFDFDLYTSIDNSFESGLGFELNLDLEELSLARYT